MNKELEALERIRKKLAKHYDIQNIYEWSNIEDDLDIIENGLKTNKKDNTLVWEDDFITIFCDQNKCLIVFINDRGDSKVLSFDDNFYSIEENILAYDELIKKTYLPDEEQKTYLGKFYRYCEEECKQGGYELDNEYLDHYGIQID